MRERRGRAPASALRVRCFEPAASRGLGPRDLSIYLCALRDLSFRRSASSHSSFTRGLCAVSDETGDENRASIHAGQLI